MFQVAPFVRAPARCPRFAALALCLSLLTTGAAQDRPPSPADMARGAAGLLQKLTQLQQVQSPDESQRAELAAAQKQLADLVASMQGEGLTLEHFVEVSSALLQEQPRAAIQVSEQGLQRFPEARFLHDHIGYAETCIALQMQPCAGQLEALRAAEAAFQKALTLQPDTWHTHVGLYQVLDHLDQPEAALRELEAAQKFPDSDRALTFLWLRRAGLLLRAGKQKDALLVLQGGDVAADDQHLARILAVRAHALAGDVAKAQQQITAMLADDKSDAATATAVDALLWLNKKADAQKLLQQRPAAGADGEDAKEVELRKQSFAAFAALAKTKDMTTAALRADLTRALGHRFLVMDQGKDGKPRELDLSGSPVMMAQLLVSMPQESVKSWANHILLALCLRAQPGYKAPADEAKFAAMMQGMKFPGAADLPAVLLSLRLGVGDPEAAGPLMALRAWEQLSDKKPAPAKK